MFSSRTVLSCFLGVGIAVSLVGCDAEKDPISPYNQLVKDMGYIGFQNPLDESATGTLIAGSPTKVAFVAFHDECFPAESIRRNFDYSQISRKFNYSSTGNFGFLTQGNPVVSAGIGFQSSYTLDIQIEGLIIEYMSAIGISQYYAWR